MRKSQDLDVFQPPLLGGCSARPHIPMGRDEVPKATWPKQGGKKRLLQPREPPMGLLMDVPKRKPPAAPALHSPPTGCSRISAGLWGFSPSAESGVLARPGGERTVGTGEGKESIIGG